MPPDSALTSPHPVFSSVDQTDNQIASTGIERFKPLYYRVSTYLLVAFMDDPAWLAFWFC